LTAYGTILVQLMEPLTALAVALSAQSMGIGLFNWLAPPLWLQVALSIVILDLTGFLQHRALHRWPLLWRCHRTHHSDIQVDAFTALRFHPFEFVFRALTKAPVILLFAVPPEAVFIGFAVAVVVDVATHLDVRLPAGLERPLALVFVLPRIHRLHHSDRPELLDTNYGTILTVWDRLAGTYRPPELATPGMTVGVSGPDALPRETLAALLMDPFRRVGPAAEAAPAPAPAARRTERV
jgi:sterol desaturase/sphingolipid hydroxylase (fatty acid hydroxylase superfamily)